MRTVAGSKSLLAILGALIFKAVAWLTSWLDTLWDLILWAVGALPDIVTGVKTALAPAEEMANWFKIPWVDVSVVVTLAVLAIVFFRHLADKRALEAAQKQAAEAAAAAPASA